MQLKTNVWVNNISSLSEARYCAGMGVQYLGFQPSRVDVKTFRDITGWISGLTFFLDISEEEHIPNILADYGCEYMLLRENQVSVLTNLQHIKQLLKIDLITSAPSVPFPHTSFIVLENWTVSQLTEAPKNSIATITEPHQIHLLTDIPLTGILLHGSAEAKPGLMDYDHLSTILELLEYNE